MIDQNNPVFLELKRRGHEWEAWRIDHQSRKQTIVDTYGWDSEELKNWYAEKEANKFPLSRGENAAYRAWAESIARQQDEIEVSEYIWESEIEDFVDTLRRAGVETIVITGTSTGLMENLHGLAAQGCTMEGLCTITRLEDRWGEEKPYEVQGIRFKVN